MSEQSEPRRSAEGVRQLEELQLQFHAESGRTRDDVDFPNKVPDIAHVQVMSEFLDKMGQLSHQQRIANSIALTGNAKFQAAVKARTEALMRYFELGDGDIWSRYERLEYRRRLIDLVGLVESGVRKLGRKLPFRPIIGTLPTRDVNAKAYAGPAGAGDIVAFETGMFTFTDVLARVAALSLTVRRGSSASGVVFDKEAVLEHIAAHPGILLDFADLLICQTYLGTCQYTDKRELPKGFGLEDTHKRLCDAADAFVLAHEYGHVILGHARTSASASDADLRDWETQADELALQITLAAFDDPKWAYAGAILFFMGIAVVDLADAVMRTGGLKVMGVPSHPSPPERLAKAASTLSASIAPQKAQTANELAQMIRWLYADLWRGLQFAFEEAHGHGHTQRVPIQIYTQKQSFLYWFLGNAFKVPVPNPLTATKENSLGMADQYRKAVHAAMAADFRSRPHLA